MCWCDKFQHILKLTMRIFWTAAANISPHLALALLAREFQCAPRTTAYLVTGYPRGEEDLAAYMEKVGDFEGINIYIINSLIWINY